MDRKENLCINVITTNQVENLSRMDLLHWVNSLLGKNVKRVEDLCSGLEYCEFLNILFPGCIAVKKIKQHANQEHEYIHNLKLLQRAFNEIGCDKAVPIEKLAKKRFQDNFEFLQWFKKFFDANFISCVERKSHVTERDLPIKPTPQKRGPTTKTKAVPGSSSNVEELTTQVAQMKLSLETVEEERDFYFQKLKNIEQMCLHFMSETPEQKQQGIDEVIRNIMDELYKTEAGAGASVDSTESE
ncbi:microtubule-associated protein RP/EB family member 1-like [Stegodyphus dumicola]|uniref:microtubule-associated protein RP/EB family member 1-like n=1 Tax=Stegodyphus dumicola TaxID=202533 RepID=UPI0015AFEEAB|nr:microtubule-associated protein RP/EB family member 1-like [Stegodyphus dumicola]